MPPIIDCYLIASPAALAAIANYNDEAWRYYAKANAFAEELGAERVVSVGDVKYMEELTLSGEIIFKPGETLPPGFNARTGGGPNPRREHAYAPDLRTKEGKKLFKRISEINCPRDATVFIMAECDTPSCFRDEERGCNRFFNDFIEARRNYEWAGMGHARRESFYLRRMRRSDEEEAPQFKGFILQKDKQ